MDGAAWHKSKSLVVPRNIRIIIQPPYSPELNPVERLWLYIKKCTIRNKVFNDVEQLHSVIALFIRSLTASKTKRVCNVNYIYLFMGLGIIPTGMSRKGKVPPGESKIKGDKTVAGDLLSSFDRIEDPRSERNRFYSLGEIVLLAFLAILCGADGWSDIENYGKAKLTYLRKFFKYSYGVPSDGYYT